MNRLTASCRLFSGMLGLAGCLISLGCATVSKGDLALDLGIKDRGMASWYGKEFHGRQAANGELFDMTALTAAHRRLPLGSLVRVVNLLNGRQVYVRINDRGPYVAGRMLDVSYAAAVELGMIARGVSVVHLEVIGEHRPLRLPLPQYHLMTKNVFAVARGSASSPASSVQGAVQWDIRSQAPTERFFPREILHERRERRGAVPSAGHSPHPLQLFA